MKVNTFCKIALTAGATALLAGVIAAPAQADPIPAGTFGTLVGLGSDTTQDVVNALAVSLGSENGTRKVASYDALESSTAVGNTVVTRPGGIAIPRVNGSGAGRDMLRVAIGQVASVTGIAASSGASVTLTSSVVGQIDFARSSGGPTTADPTGAVTYVPFARDAVDVAVDPDGPLALVPWRVGVATDAKDAPTLYNVYRGDVQYAYTNGTTYIGVGKTATLPTGAPAGTIASKIQPVLPKFGSGTRSYFVGQIGGTDAAGLAGSTGTWTTVKDKYTPTGTTTEIDIQEHTGAAIDEANDGLPSGTYAIGPFSIGQYVAQKNAVNGLTDRTSNVVLTPLGKLSTDAAVAATTVTAGKYATNTAYAAMVRNVYNIVPSKLADQPTSNIAKTFVGSSALLCQSAAATIIQQYGFLPALTTGADQCGDKTLRAYPASVSTTTLSVPDTTTVGNAVTATATVTSISNGGGTINFMKGDTSTVLATATIPNGGTQASASIAAASAGSVPVTAVFVPTLTGVASSTSAQKSFAVTTVPVETTTPVDTTPVVTTPVVTTPVVTTPVVTTPVVTAPVPAAAPAAAVKKTTPKITVSKIKTVKIGKTSKITIKVTGKTTATGTVTVKDGKKVVVNKAKLKKGKVTVSIKKVKKGSHKLTVTYNGNTVYKVAKKTGLVLKAV